MPAYNYIALNNLGKETHGVLEGDSPRQIRLQLKEKGLIPVEINHVSEKNKAHKTSFANLRNRVSVAELSLLTRQLATMLSAGIPLEESLMSVAEQCENKTLKSIMTAVRTRVLEGFGLAQAMADFPKVFSTLYRATIAAGEKTGRLDLVLDKLADFTERQYEMRQKILQALIYPSLIVIASMGIVTFLLSYVVPKMVSTFQTNDAVLPGVTILLLAISSFIQHYGLYALIGIVIFIFIWRRMLKREEFRYWCDKTILRLPLFGKMSRLINTSRYAHTLAILSSAGVEMIEAMHTATETTSNLVIHASLKNATRQVREGVMIWRALKETHYFPAMSIHLIASGENSGSLENMLNRAAQNQERDVERSISILMTLFEPVIILIMGGVVLFIVLAILLPIFNLDQLVN